tara:strand:- start:6773 stop:7603 length:831 start_codon:yes stop_codon:yes gene_type:complete
MKNKKSDDTNKNYNRPQTCRNCGITGHLYKDCIHPIMSFGIICYKIENKQIKYLMIQRKDTLSFMEFVRGKYNLNDIEYITELIHNMTLNEKNLIKNKIFDNIWNYAWYQSNNVTIKHTNEYIESKKKYTYLLTNSIIDYIFNNYDNKKKHSEQEWGFPKGRRKLKETNVDCAVREFCEETRLSKTDFDIKTNFNNFEEVFYGSNNILYKHSYYIAKINKKVNLFIDKNCMEQVREIRDLKWFTFNEVINKIEPKNIERIEIFKLTNKLILDYEKN